MALSVPLLKEKLLTVSFNVLATFDANLIIAK